MSTPGVHLTPLHIRHRSQDVGGTEKRDVSPGMLSASGSAMTTSSSSSRSVSSLLASRTDVRTPPSVIPLEYLRKRASRYALSKMDPYAVTYRSDLAECPACGSAEAVQTLGYWPAYEEPVRICLFSPNGAPSAVCRYTWIDREPYAQCSCGEYMEIEQRMRDFYYVCAGCQSIGFD